MTGGTLALGITFAALCVATGITIGWPIGNRRGWKHAAEEAEWRQQDARWQGLAGRLDAPVPVRPPAPPQAPRDGPGRHRHPAGPPRHADGPRHADAELPAAGYLPAAPWDGTLTLTMPAQTPPWDMPEPEPRTQVLEPTAADCLRPDTLTDTGWTRQEARRLVEEMDADIERITADGFGWIAERIGATDSTLKAITK